MAAAPSMTRGLGVHEAMSENMKLTSSLPLENGWLEDDPFPFGASWGLFSGAVDCCFLLGSRNS